MSAKPPALRTCIICGCTEDHACPGGCAWSWKDRTKGGTRGGCTRCAFVLGHLAAYRKSLKLTAADRQAFELGAFATLKISREWPR